MKDIILRDGNVRFTCRVSLIIEKGDKLLFQVMPKDTSYTLVGGKMSLMETSRETLVRKLKEETGYDVTVRDKIKLVEIAENFFDYIDGDGKVQKIHNILFIYKIILDENSSIRDDKEFLMLDKENTRLCWISKEEARRASVLPKEAKNFIDKDEFVYGIINDLQYEVD